MVRWIQWNRFGGVNRMGRIVWKLNTRVSSVAAGRDSWTTVSVWVPGAILFGSLAGEIRRRGVARYSGANRIR
jgi:hypothetical protein